jgi:hypothetical protein
MGGAALRLGKNRFPQCLAAATDHKRTHSFVALALVNMNAHTRIIRALLSGDTEYVAPLAAE